MSDVFGCSGPYRRVTEDEFYRLTDSGVPGEWAEGCGFVVYDELAREEFYEARDQREKKDDRQGESDG